MARLPDISEAEWKVMKLLWGKSPQAAYDLSMQLGRQEGWSASTVKTLLSRLHKKGAVTVERYKNLFLYAPKVTEAECAAREADSLVDRVFGGALEPLLLHFAKRKKLGPAEVAELKRILGENPSSRKPS
jgi:BlaI family penicillinase repressor